MAKSVTKKPGAVPYTLPVKQARAIWIAAQALDRHEPFGAGPGAVEAAVKQLGYVQIDTINVIERCHHHILYNRIPAYRRADLATAQSVDKSVFEYWTHALSYVPRDDFAFFAGEMRRHRLSPNRWYADVPRKHVLKLVKRVREEGALTISDIKDDALTDKDHPWASRKPSKQALQCGFFNGELVISHRKGMLKTYELTERHFGWETPPKPASASAVTRYVAERALRAQGLVSVESACHLNAKAKPEIKAHFEKELRARRLVELRIAGDDRTVYYARPEVLETPAPEPELTHILSPFDPLIIQRKRTARFFDYEHVFEAYVTKAKRKFGYFTLPVLSGDEIIAALDLKAERATETLLIQAWHWIGKGNAAAHQAAIDAALDRFSAFQFAEF